MSPTTKSPPRPVKGRQELSKPWQYRRRHPPKGKVPWYKRPAPPGLRETALKKQAELRARVAGSTRYAIPPPPPRFKPGPVAAKLDTSSASCLVHGINADYVGLALDARELGSAFARSGPNGKYSRTADKIGGGATAVYTRAVGTQHDDWPAKGCGVGSDPITKVQLVISPAVLERPEHVWRASSFDRMGMLPGAETSRSATAIKDVNKVRSLWEQQSQNDRNTVWNGTVTNAEVPDGNEQYHYQRLPLEGYLKAAVCSSWESFEALMATEGARRLDPPEGNVGGYIRVGAQEVQVLCLDGDESLIDGLKAAGIADEDGRVR